MNLENPNFIFYFNFFFQKTTGEVAFIISHMIQSLFYKSETVK